MDIETKFSLYVNGEKIAEDGDTIELKLVSGEIIVGRYEYSEHTSLQLDRKSCCIDIDFDEIQSVRKIG